MFDWLPTWWLLPSLKPRLQHDDKGLRNRGYGSGRHNARWALQQVWRTASSRWGVTKPRGADLHLAGAWISLTGLFATDAIGRTAAVAGQPCLPEARAGAVRTLVRTKVTCGG
jgi:hypothetical protein